MKKIFKKTVNMTTATSGNSTDLVATVVNCTSHVTQIDIKAIFFAYVPNSVRDVQYVLQK